MRNVGLMISILSVAVFAAQARQSGGAQPSYSQNAQQQAEEHQQTHPTLVGCIASSGKSQFILTEQKSGTRYRLEASPQELKDHVNHLVEVVGRPARPEGGVKAVAGQNEPAFEVSGIQDLAPTCGTPR